MAFHKIHYLVECNIESNTNCSSPRIDRPPHRSDWTTPVTQIYWRSPLSEWAGPSSAHKAEKILDSAIPTLAPTRLYLNPRPLQTPKKRADYRNPLRALYPDPILRYPASPHPRPRYCDWLTGIPHRTPLYCQWTSLLDFSTEWATQPLDWTTDWEGTRGISFVDDVTWVRR